VQVVLEVIVTVAAFTETLKLITILESRLTPVASLAGVVEVTVGGTVALPEPVIPLSAVPPPRFRPPQ
jgi:hypothetical protein